MSKSYYLATSIAAMLNDFLDQTPKEAFSVDQDYWINTFQQEINVGSGVGSEAWATFRDIEDTAFVIEMSELLAQFQSWCSDVHDIRQQYFYDKMTNELPDPFEMVFGFTSPVMRQYHDLIRRFKLLRRLLETKWPSGQVREPEIRKLFEEMWPKGKKAQRDRQCKQRSKQKGRGFDDLGFHTDGNKWYMYRKDGTAMNSGLIWRYLKKADSEKVGKFFS